VTPEAPKLRKTNYDRNAIYIYRDIFGK